MESGSSGHGRRFNVKQHIIPTYKRLCAAEASSVLMSFA